MIVLLVLPPLLAAIWFGLEYEEIQRLALDVFGVVLAIAVVLSIRFLVFRRWNYRP